MGQSEKASGVGNILTTFWKGTLGSLGERTF